MVITIGVGDGNNIKWLWYIEILKVLIVYSLKKHLNLYA